MPGKGRHRGGRPVRRELAMRRCSVPVVAIAIVGLGLVVGHPTLGTIAQEGTPEGDSTEAVVLRSIDALNQALATGDMTGIDAAFAADYVDHTAGISPAGQQ